MSLSKIPLPATAADRAKATAAARAVNFVESGMKLGLGTGSTAAWMVYRLAERIRDEGLKVVGVPTSRRTGDLAASLGIPVTGLDEAGWLDLTIDGADEFDGALNLVKGGGGALLREKIVAAASDRMVVIADAAKEVEVLGAFPLPVEVIPFGWQSTRLQVEELLSGQEVDGRGTALRMAGAEPFRTDEGNYILDLALGRIGDAGALALLLNRIPGVVENGLFVEICDTVIIGHPEGRVELRGTLMPPRPDGPGDNIFADLSE